MLLGHRGRIRVRRSGAVQAKPSRRLRFPRFEFPVESKDLVVSGKLRRGEEVGDLSEEEAKIVLERVEDVRRCGRDGGELVGGWALYEVKGHGVGAAKI